IPVKAGPHAIGVAFIRKNSSESDEPLQPHTRDHDLQNMNGIPLIDYVTIAGPFDASGPGDTPSRRRVLVCRPSSQQDEPAFARKILSTLARRAYRRPVSNDDVDFLMTFYTNTRRKGTFEDGIQSALRFILTSPSFLFRGEPDPKNAAQHAVYQVSDL